MGICGIFLYLRLVRQASRYAVITGKGYRPRLIRLGAWKYVALSLVALFVIVKVVLPFCVLIYASFLRFYVPPTRAFLGQMPWTFQNYDELLDYRFFGKFFINTIIVSLGAATATMILVSFIGWLVVRRPGPLSNMINLVAFTPLAVPGIISTLALFLMFVGTPLVGTLLLLILAFVARYLAFGTRLMHATMLQVHRELEEAAQTSGATGLQIFVGITLRLLMPAFLNGWLWILVHAAKDFSVALFLASAGSVVVANIIYQDFSSGRFNESAAALVFLVVFNLMFVITGRRWIRRAAEQ
jgi:iron(III) transport system permease protein